MATLIRRALTFATVLLAATAGSSNAQQRWGVHANVGAFDGYALSGSDRYVPGPGALLELSVDRSLTRSLRAEVSALLLQKVEGSVVCNASGTVGGGKDVYAGGFFAGVRHVTGAASDPFGLSVTGGGGFVRVAHVARDCSGAWLLGDGPALTAGTDLRLPGLWRISPQVGMHAIRILGAGGSHIDILRAQATLRSR